MEKLKQNKIICYIVIIIVAMILNIPLINSGIDTGHDGDFHISRTIGTIEQIQNRESPFIISRYSNNLGFAWNLFYPPISTLINIFFATMTNNVVIAMKLFIFCTFLFSGIFMFQFVSKLAKNKKVALIASCIYMCAPYRMLNAYMRVAVGEMLSFVFIPLIFLGIFKILNKETKTGFIFVIGTIGLVLSHNISTMIVFIICCVYLLVNIKKLKDKEILKNFIVSGIIIALAVICFEIPLIEQKMSCEYEVFRYGKMYSNDSVQYHALNPLQLLYRNAPGPDDSMFFCIGILILIGLILTPFVKVKDEIKSNYKFFLILGIVTTIMATFLFPWIVMPDILLMIQFPWRLLVIVVFSFSIISAINICTFIDENCKNLKKAKLVEKLILSSFIILGCIYAFSFIMNLKLEDKNNEFYKEEEIIDTTNQVSRYSSFLEYWPQKAIDSMDYIVNRDDKVAVISGKLTIENDTKENGVLNFDFLNAEENTSLELPYLFYKGYEVKYIPEGSTEQIDLEVYETDKGLVGVDISKEMKGHIQAEYHITSLHKTCLIISLITIIGYMIYVVYLKIKKIGDNSGN